MFLLFKRTFVPQDGENAGHPGCGGLVQNNVKSLILLCFYKSTLLAFSASSCFLSFYGKIDKKGDLSFVTDSLFAW